MNLTQISSSTIPLTGSETVNGCTVIEWRDAGFFCPGPVYEDWAVSAPCACPSPTPNTCVDGYANEIWLRLPTHAATTIATGPGYHGVRYTSTATVTMGFAM